MSVVCQSYATRMHSHVIRMSLACTRMSSVCHSYVLVCHPNVICMYFYVIRIASVCGFTMKRVISICVILIEDGKGREGRKFFATFTPILKQV